MFVFTPNTLIESSKVNANFNQLNNGDIDWSNFSNNIKSATNPSDITPTNSSQDLASGGLTLSYTVSSDCYAFVNVSLTMHSTTDFEFRPEIRVDGSIVQTFSPSASLATGYRAVERSFSYGVSLTAGSHTISAGVFLSSSTGASMRATGSTISAIVLWRVIA